jgi:neutral ceramidase
MNPPVTVRRNWPKRVPPQGHPRCGAAEIDMTPHEGLPMAGYSWAGKYAKGIRGRLFVRALYLEDAQGNCAVLCFLDLLSASRYLLEKTASMTATTCGISVDRLLLAGTHTHTGPGQFYGNSLYDQFAQAQPGFDRALADWISGRVAKAILEAADNAVPAQVGCVTRTLWGVSRNRSLLAFEKNQDMTHWDDSRWPGHGAPSSISCEQWAVDPRVKVLAAIRLDNKEPIALFGTFGCHATSLGPRVKLYSPDWPGAAVREARARLNAQYRIPPIVAVAGSGGGDINALGTCRAQGPELANYAGARVGEVLAATAEEARKVATGFDLAVGYEEVSTIEHTVDGNPETRLAEHWAYGAPTLAGSEDGRSLLYHLGLVREGMTGAHFSPQDPQYPKVPPLFGLPALLFNVNPSPVLPLHILNVGGHIFVTVPGEPTAMAAYRIEKAVRQQTFASWVNVLGYAGDYSGYFTTEEEYAAQHYEGSSNIYGRHSLRHIQARIQKLLTNKTSQGPLQGTMTFFTGRFVEGFSIPQDDGRKYSVQPIVRRAGIQLEITWRTPRDLRVLFAEGYFARLEESVNGQWRPVQLEKGIHVDDVSYDIEIFRRYEAFGAATWNMTMRLPWEPTPNHPLRIRAATRPNFPGFIAPIE